MPSRCAVLCRMGLDTLTLLILIDCRRSEKGDSVSFPEMAVMSQPGFSIGAHAMRGLVFSQPSRIEVSQRGIFQSILSKERGCAAG